MATTPKLTVEEKAFFETPPEDIPLEDAADEEEDAVVEADAGEADDKTTVDAAKPDEKKADEKKPDEKVAPKKQTTVPHGAMEAERHKRKVAEEALRNERSATAERQARLDERLSILNEALKPRDVAPIAPDPDEDIFGYAQHLGQELEALKNETAAEREQRKQEVAQRQQETTQQQQNRQLVGAYQADAAVFEQEHPDFKAAYKHLMTARDKQLSRIPTFRNDPVARQNAIQNDEMQIALAALQSGESPAEVIYGLAQDFGYKPPDAEEEVTTEEVVTNGAANSKTNGADKGTTEIARLAKIKDVSTSLSQAGGAAGKTDITLESLDRMSPDEFKAFVAKINRGNPKGYDRLVEKLTLGRS